MTTNLRKSLIALILVAATVAANAVPAMKGVRRTVKMANGKTISVELRGDEHGHYWIDSVGNGYRKVVGQDFFQQIDLKKVKFEIAEKVKLANQQRAPRLQKARKAAQQGSTSSAYLGKKKGIIILVQFTDTKFKLGHNQSFYDKMANQLNYSTSLGYVGSVKDYFLAQSNGQFELDFDVVGPYTLKHECAYYGGNDDDGNDKRPGAMVAEACKAADSEVDFYDYDWDGDGYVDQVFVLYAGKNEAAYGDDDTIWPHMYNLASSDYGSSLVTADGAVVNTYACSSELTAIAAQVVIKFQADGIGTLCHEFSHCLGYPDLYDTGYGGNFGMGSFDLLSSGSYNNHGFCPPNYSAYEKWAAGWIEPVELTTATTVKGMSPQGMRYGEAYVVYNDAHKDEYYLLENRQQNTDIWDASLAASGLMIMHVDYNKYAWAYNNVNTIVNYSNTYGSQYAYLDNDHERLTIFHADNETSNEAGDLYPYNGNNSLTDSSTPSASIYNEGTFMGKPITNIVQNSDGTIDFDFMGGSDDHIITGIQTLQTEPTPSAKGVYSLDGRYLGTDATTLPKGVYVVDGRKIVK